MKHILGRKKGFIFTLQNQAANTPNRTPSAVKLNHANFVHGLDDFTLPEIQLKKSSQELEVHHAGFIHWRVSLSWFISVTDEACSL